MEINGIVKQVGKTQQITEKFSKRELVLKTEYESKYPQYVLIQFSNTKVALLDNIFPGEIVTVSINLRGKEVNNGNGIKYYNTLDGWKIVKNDEPTGTPVDPTPIVTDFSSEDSTDLPF